MIRLAITAAAFEAIARTLPLGSVGYEAEANERGEARNRFARLSKTPQKRQPRGTQHRGTMIVAAAQKRSVRPRSKTATSEPRLHGNDFQARQVGVSGDLPR